MSYSWDWLTLVTLIGFVLAVLSFILSLIVRKKGARVGEYKEFAFDPGEAEKSAKQKREQLERAVQALEAGDRESKREILDTTEAKRKVEEEERKHLAEQKNRMRQEEERRRLAIETQRKAEKERLREQERQRSEEEARRKTDERNRAQRRSRIMAYDVFISFKNTNERGVPTQDAKLANEVYNFLRSKGLRVFISTVTLESLGVSNYKKAIDEALDAASIVVAVGTSTENLDSEWVRYEWDGFYNDILTGVKPGGKLFTYVAGMRPAQLPRTLRQTQTFIHSSESLEQLHGFIDRALHEE